MNRLRFPTVPTTPPLTALLGALTVSMLAACGSSTAPATTSNGGAGGNAGAALRGICGQAIPAAGVERVPNSGRKLTPIGRPTLTGNFPSGGRLSPDGRYYWSVSAGHAQNDVHIVDVASGALVQVLPLPGSYGQMVFTADGSRAYVSGTPKGGSTPSGPTLGDAGDVIHVFDVDVASGRAVEKTPLALPATTGGSGRLNQFPPSTGSFPNGPAGLAVTPDGKTLVVALYNADKVAIIDTASGSASTANTGAYPFAVGIERSGRYAYVANAYDGTLSKIDLQNTSPLAQATTISGLGGPDGDHNAQPQYVLPDPKADRLFVAVTNHDGVAIVDTTTDTVTRFVSLKPAQGYGAQPVAVALAPDGNTLYAADAGEAAVAAIALSDRSDGSAKAFDVIGRLPTSDYTTDVALTPDGCTLVWQAARNGNGSQANPGYTSTHGFPAVNNDPSVSPPRSYTPDQSLGTVGVLPTPTDEGFRRFAPMVAAAQIPENAAQPPADTPVHGAKLADGRYAPSSQIKYVFYVVKENRTYDQIFGSDRRGNGDPGLQVLEDNCGPANTAFLGRDRSHHGCGTTPNAHAISRDYVLLDNFYEDSEVSVDGHVITAGAYATNYSLKSMHQDYSGRVRPANEVGVFPVTFGPKNFLFDQAASQGLSFRNYGELSGGASPVFSADSRSTYAQVIANSDTVDYPSNVFLGCVNNTNAPNSPLCAFDCGRGCNTMPLPQPTVSLSRIDAFERQFTLQSLSCNALTLGTPACAVPQFNYFVMLSNHTNGVGDGARDPLAMVADNDLGVGQLLDIISHSPIWSQSVLFVVEDDSQDGADHVDAHRAPALVAGPYVKRGGAVISTRYDQVSVVRTIELILGLDPLSVFDAVATPMYDVFTATADLTPYSAIQPEQDLLALCPCTPYVPGATSSLVKPVAASTNAQLSNALPYSTLDRVPQAISDRILWQRVFGEQSTPPPSGPNASSAEHARALETLRLFEQHRANPARAKREIGRYLARPETDAD